MEGSLPTLEELNDRFSKETKEYSNMDESYQVLDSTNRSIDLHGESGKLLNLRGMAHRGLDELEKALANFTRAIRIDSSPWVYYCNRATTLVSLDRDFEAIQDLNMAIELQPSVPQCRYLRAKLYMKQQNYTAAVQDFSAGILNDGSPFRAYFGRGRCLQCLGKTKESIADYQTAKALSGIEAGGYNDLGMVLYELGLSTDAHFCFTKAVRAHASVAAYHNNLGLANVQLERYKEAANSFEIAQNLDDRNPQVYVNRGNMWLAQNNPSKAILDMELAVSLDPARPESLFALGLAHQQAGGTDNLTVALEMFNKSLLINDNDTASRFHAALVNRKIGALVEALRLLNRCAEDSPTDALVFETRGLIHQGMGNHAAALSDFTMVISQAPEVGENYYYRGESRRRLGLLEAAEVDLNTAIELEFRDACVFSSRAMVKYARGNYSAAVLDAMVSLELSVDKPDTEILLNASLCFQRMHNFKRAESLATDALDLAPENGDVRLWLQRGIVRREAGLLQSGCGDLERALETAGPKDGKIKLKAWTNLAYACAGLGNLIATIFYLNRAIEAICFEDEASRRCSGDIFEESDLEGKEQESNELYSDGGNQLDSNSRISEFASPEVISKTVRRLESEKDTDMESLLLNLVIERAKSKQVEGRHNEAIKDLNLMITHAPRCANAFFYRAFSFKALKDLDSAAADFEHAKELEPSNPQLVVSYRKIYSIPIKHLRSPGEEEITLGGVEISSERGSTFGRHK